MLTCRNVHRYSLINPDLSAKAYHIIWSYFLLKYLAKREIINKWARKPYCGAERNDTVGERRKGWRRWSHWLHSCRLVRTRMWYMDHVCTGYSPNPAGFKLMHIFFYITLLLPDATQISFQLGDPLLQTAPKTNILLPSLNGRWFGQLGQREIAVIHHSLKICWRWNIFASQ